MASDDDTKKRAYADPVHDQPDLVRLFWSNVEKTPACWVWTGHVKAGRPRFVIARGVEPLAYRTAWEIERGVKLGRRQYLYRTCDEPRCVRPKHYSMRKGAGVLGNVARRGKPSPKLPVMLQPAIVNMLGRIDQQSAVLPKVAALVERMDATVARLNPPTAAELSRLVVEGLLGRIEEIIQPVVEEAATRAAEKAAATVVMSLERRLAALAPSQQQPSGPVSAAGGAPPANAEPAAPASGDRWTLGRDLVSIVHQAWGIPSDEEHSVAAVEAMLRLFDELVIDLDVRQAVARIDEAARRAPARTSVPSFAGALRRELVESDPRQHQSRSGVA